MLAMLLRPFCCSSSQRFLNHLAESVPDEGYSRNVSWTLNLISMFLFHCVFTKNIFDFIYFVYLNNHDKNGWYNGRTLKLGRLILYTMAFRLLITYVMICHEFIQSNQFDSSKRMSIEQIKFFVYTGKKIVCMVVLNGNIINIEKKIVVYYVEKSTDYYLPTQKLFL